MQKRTNTRDRLHCIRQIVASQAIERQEALLRELQKAGFTCTQSMLSRDLRQLRISKVRRKDGTNAYALPSEGQFVEVPTRAEQDDRRWAVHFSGNLMVLHTPPGHASMVAYEIDAAHDASFLGTVAGDDTIFVALADDVARDEALTAICRIVPKLNRK